jgi:hypothetical protein
MLIPPVPTTTQLTRVANAYSPVEEATPGGQKPIPLKGEWATFYLGHATGAAPSLEDRSVWGRFVALALGHLALTLALLAGAFASLVSAIVRRRTYAAPRRQDYQ